MQGGVKKDDEARLRDLLLEVLYTLKQPFTENVIDDVCVAIEGNSEWRRRYGELEKCFGSIEVRIQECMEKLTGGVACGYNVARSHLPGLIRSARLVGASADRLPPMPAKAPAKPSPATPPAAASSTTRPTEPPQPGGSVRFTCPSCKKPLWTKPEFAGRRLRCPSCGNLITLPSGETASPAAPPPAEQRSPDGNQILKELLAKIRKGQPAQIAYADQDEAFENRVGFMQAWADEGTLPPVTLIVLDACNLRASKPHLLLRSGPHDDYLRFYRESGNVETLRRLMPGKTWDDVAGAAEANFDLPGSRLASMQPFNSLLAEIEMDLYTVRGVIAPGQHLQRSPSTLQRTSKEMERTAEEMKRTREERGRGFTAPPPAPAPAAHHATCDHCRGLIEEPGGYLFFSSATFTLKGTKRHFGNVFLCEACTNTLINDTTFNKSRPIHKEVSIDDLQTVPAATVQELEEMKIDGIIGLCRRVGHDPEGAREMARGMAGLWWNNPEDIQTLCAEIWMTSPPVKRKARPTRKEQPPQPQPKQQPPQPQPERPKHRCRGCGATVEHGEWFLWCPSCGFTPWYLAFGGLILAAALLVGGALLWLTQTEGGVMVNEHPTWHIWIGLIAIIVGYIATGVMAVVTVKVLLGFLWIRHDSVLSRLIRTLLAIGVLISPAFAYHYGMKWDEEYRHRLVRQADEEVPEFTFADFQKQRPRLAEELKNAETFAPPYYAIKNEGDSPADSRKEGRWVLVPDGTSKIEEAKTVLYIDTEQVTTTPADPLKPTSVPQVKYTMTVCFIDRGNHQKRRILHLSEPVKSDASNSSSQFRILVQKACAEASGN
jgi:hypothetical protein